MQLSSKTLDILRNFVSINAGIVIRPGNVIATKAANNTMMASATVEENFPTTIALYDLNQFLATLSTFQSPEVEFEEKTITISESTDPRVSFKGLYGQESQIVTLTKPLNMPPAAIEFNLSNADFSKLLKMANVQSFKNILVTKNDDGKIILVASDIENPSTNSFTIETEADAPNANFQMVFSKDTLNLLKGDYAVSIAKEGIAKFSNQSTDLVYYIATLDKSYYK